MKLTVKRDELRSRLSLIQNIVEKNFTMPLLSHFLLNAQKDGATITATDLNVSIREPLEAAIDEIGEVCIPAKKLLVTLSFADSVSPVIFNKQWRPGSYLHSYADKAVVASCPGFTCPGLTCQSIAVQT